MKINKKIFKNALLIFCGLSTMTIIPSILINYFNSQAANNIDTKSFHRNKTNLNNSNFALSNNTNNVATTPNRVIMPKVDTSGILNLESAPMQYYAADNIYFSGYALLTSSNQNQGNYDQITKFSSQSPTTGKAEWIVKKSDLGQLINVANVNELKINSIQFILGDVLQAIPSSIMVLLNSVNATNNGTYLFKIIWDGNDYGKYELISKVGNENFNFMISIDNNLAIYNLPKISNINPNNLDILYVSFNPNSIPNTFPSTKKITISSDIIATYFNQESVALDLFYLNNQIYVIYQAKTSTNSINSFFTIMQFSKNNISNNIDINITSSSIAKLNLETLFVGINAIFTTANNDYLSTFSFINNSNNNLSLLISQSSNVPSITNSGNYALVNVDLSNLFSASPNISILTFAYPPSFGYYFINVEKLYSSNSNQVLGYVAIDSNDLAVELDLNFNYKRSLYNFKTATPSLGNIYNIYTKPNDQNWYAQMTDTTIAQMYSNSLIGQWDKVFAAPTSLELPAIVNIRPSSEVLAGAIFTNVANAQKNGYSQEFLTLMASNTSYNNFLNVVFTDPRLGTKLPEINISYSAFSPSTTNNYSIQLTFKQKLRTLDPNGNQIAGPTSESIIAIAIFNFINGEGQIISSNDPVNGFQIPTFIKKSLPSSITQNYAFEYLLRIQNVLKPKLLLKPNDLLGTLYMEIEIPYIWIANQLVLNKIFVFEFGTESAPYFTSNPLSQQDISVTLYDREFLLQNPLISKELTIKYASLLPSNITKDNVLNDFVKFGSAFLDPSNDPYISKLTSNDINIVPLDSTGELFVEFTFAKLGNKINVRYSFTVSGIFLVNPTANDSVFFIFKSNEEVLSTDIDNNPNTTEVYRDFRPSQLTPNLINSNNTKLQLETLNNYANFSNYFSNILNVNSPTGSILMTISTETDDSSGLLTIIINLENPLPNSETKVIRKSFSGFRKSGNVIGTPSSFQFNNMPNVLLAKSATSITEDDLFINNVLQISGQTNNLNREIKLAPINESGVLMVNVVFFNWIESVAGATSILPIKEFSRIYVGFPVTKPALYGFVWKSFVELPDAYKNLNGNDFVSTISSLGNNYVALSVIATFSDILDSFLSANPNNIEVQYNVSANGSAIQINASISGLLGSNSVNSFSTTLSGFALIEEPSIFVSWVQNNDPVIQQLKTKYPSEILSNEIGLFYSVSGVEGFSRSSQIIYDDIAGTLVIKLSFQYANQSNPIQFEQKYSSFKINKPIYKGTDWTLIAIIIGIPLVVLLIPLFIILFIRYKLDKYRVIKKLNARLDEQNRNSKKTKNIKSTKDLID